MISKNTTTTAPSGASVPARAPYDLNDLQVELSQLYELLGVCTDIVMEFDYGQGEGRNAKLDRLNAMLFLAYGHLGAMNDRVDANFATIGSTVAVRK